MTPKIKIVIPFYSEFEAVKPGLKMLSKDRAIGFDVQPVQGPYVHCNRNLGVNLGRSSMTFQGAPDGYSHYLFLDSDIGFTPAHLYAALRHKAPVVTLPYLRHEDDGFYQVGELGPDFTINSRYNRHEFGVRHVTFAGAGFLLIESWVFGAIPFPWFHHSMVTVGEKSYAVGEDVMFSRKLLKAGIPTLCDFDYPVPHRLRSPEDFDVSF